MPAFFVCPEPGCSYFEWNGRHECPQPGPGMFYPIEKTVPKKTVYNITMPTPPPRQSTDVDGSDFVSQDDNFRTALKRDQMDTSKDPPVYIFQYPDFSDDRQDVVIMTWGKDKSGRLIIVLPFDERGVKYSQKYLKCCLKLCVSDGQRFRKDSNGFTAIIDRMQKKDDVKFVVKTLNRELKGSLKLILIVKSRVKTDPTVNERIGQTKEFQTPVMQRDTKEIVTEEHQHNALNTLENDFNTEGVQPTGAGSRMEPKSCKSLMIEKYKHSQFVPNKQIVGIITKPRNSSFNQAGVTRFCKNTDAVDPSSSFALDETNDTKTNFADVDLNKASDCFDGIGATTNIATLSDDADEPRRVIPCIPKYLPPWRLTEYVNSDQLDAILPNWNK